MRSKHNAIKNQWKLKVADKNWLNIGLFDGKNKTELLVWKLQKPLSFLTKHWKLTLFVGILGNSTLLTGKPKKSIKMPGSHNKNFCRCLPVSWKKHLLMGTPYKKIRMMGKPCETISPMSNPVEPIASKRMGRKSLL